MDFTINTRGEDAIALIVAYVIIFAPAIFLTLRWSRRGPLSHRQTVVLVLLSSSYAWLLVGMFVPLVLGPHYSDRRSCTILANLAASALCTILFAVRNTNWRGFFCLA